MIAELELGFAFREPLAWWLCTLVVVAIVQRARSQTVVGFAAHAVCADGAPLPRTWRQRLAATPLVLEAVALLLLVAALARPVEVASEPPRRLGRDVLLCLDRSSSMAEQDLSDTSSRLQVGKRLGAEFLLQRVDDRVGVVTFARYADLVCAPTVDHIAATELLGRVDLVDSEGPEDATAIGAAIGMAANLLQRGGETAGKVIVLLTDGEENVAVAGAPDQIAPLHAGQWCRDHGVRVHCIALGKSEAVDTTAVRQVAKITGGGFFSAVDEQALRAVYAAIDELERARFAEPGVHVTEWFALPLAVALCAWLLAHLWRGSRLGVQP